MRRRVVLTASLILALGGVALLVRLRLESQLPKYDLIRAHLYLHRGSMETLAEALLAEPELTYVGISDDRVIGGTKKQYRVAIPDQTAKRYRKLLHAADVGFMFKPPRFPHNAVVELPGVERSGRSLHPLLMYGPDPGLPLCADQYREEKRGRCAIPLRGKWFLQYAWRDLTSAVEPPGAAKPSS